MPSFTHSQRSEEGLAALRSSQKPGIPLGASGISPSCIEFQSFLPLPESGLKLNLSFQSNNRKPPSTSRLSTQEQEPHSLESKSSGCCTEGQHQHREAHWQVAKETTSHHLQKLQASMPTAPLTASVLGHLLSI